MSKGIRVTVSLEPEQYRWIEKMMEKQIFASKSHAVRRGLEELREKQEEIEEGV